MTPRRLCRYTRSSLLLCATCSLPQPQPQPGMYVGMGTPPPEGSRGDITIYNMGSVPISFQLSGEGLRYSKFHHRTSQDNKVLVHKRRQNDVGLCLDRQVRGHADSQADGQDWDSLLHCKERQRDAPAWNIGTRRFPSQLAGRIHKGHK